MREITALPAPGRATLGEELWRWLRRPHQFTLTPLGGLVAAAALTVGVLLYRMASTPPAPPQGESRAFQFVLVAPRATHVELVGDFNDWDATRTPIRGSSGWTPPRGRPLWRSSIGRTPPCSLPSHSCSVRSKARRNAPPGTRSSPPCGVSPRTWATPATPSGRRPRQPSSPRGLRRSAPGRPKRPWPSCGTLGESPLPYRSPCLPISWRAESPSTARPLPYSASPRGPETRTWSSSVAPSSVTSLWAPPPRPPPRPRRRPRTCS